LIEIQKNILDLDMLVTERKKVRK